MKSNLGRLVLGIAVVAAAVVLLILLKDDDSGDEPSGGTAATEQPADSRPTGSTGKQAEPPIPVIVVKNGEPVGGAAELTFDKGERIRFEVESNVSDEIHVHGYDIEKEIEAGGSVSFDFPATLEGVFDAELHGSGEQIAELRIEP